MNMDEWVRGCDRVLKHYALFRTLPPKQRHDLVAALRGRGWGLQEIADATGYRSREHVRMILKRRTGEG
jgi:hypothetical protein